MIQWQQAETSKGRESVTLGNNWCECEEWTSEQCALNKNQPTQINQIEATHL